MNIIINVYYGYVFFQSKTGPDSKKKKKKAFPNFLQIQILLLYIHWLYVLCSA